MDDFEVNLEFMEIHLKERAKGLRKSIEEDGDPLQIHRGGKVHEIESTIDSLGERDSAIAFFAIATEILEIFETELFEATFIKSEYRDSTIDGYVGKSRRDVFSRFDVLDPELRSKIQETRDYRNQLIHEPLDTQMATKVGELEDRISTALGAVEELKAIVDERSSS